MNPILKKPKKAFIFYSAHQTYYFLFERKNIEIHTASLNRIMLVWGILVLILGTFAYMMRQILNVRGQKLNLYLLGFDLSYCFGGQKLVWVVCVYVWMCVYVWVCVYVWGGCVCMSVCVWTYILKDHILGFFPVYSDAQCCQKSVWIKINSGLLRAFLRERKIQTWHPFYC